LAGNILVNWSDIRGYYLGSCRKVVELLVRDEAAVAANDFAARCFLEDSGSSLRAENSFQRWHHFHLLH